MASEKMHVLIVAPSLDVERNVSGVSAVTDFIIDNNRECEYRHFLQGKSDDERGLLKQAVRLLRTYQNWKGVLKEEGGSVIHYNFPLDAASILRDYFFMRAAHRRNIRMVIHLHGGLYLFKEQKPFVIRCILNEVFGWENNFIVLSNKEKDYIQKNYHTRNVHVLPNCVDMTDASTFTRTFDSSGHLHILYLGRIEPNKGMEYLYEAMTTWECDNKNFTLHLAGIEQGEEKYVSRLAHLLGNRFCYEGVVSGERKSNLLRQCQVFLLPSFYEGLPMSLLECMSYGLVPVVTNVGSIGEYVKDGENGLLIGIKDSSSIVASLARLQNDRDLLKKLSAASRETVFTLLNPTNYISELNRIYATSF